MCHDNPDERSVTAQEIRDISPLCEATDDCSGGAAAAVAAA